MESLVYKPYLFHMPNCIAFVHGAVWHSLCCFTRHRHWISLWTMVNIGLYVSVHRSSSYKNLVKEKLEFF